MKLDKIKHFFRLPGKEYAIKTSKKYLLILIISVFISMFFMKKITADYNDTVTINNGHIYVNDQDYGQIENLSIPVPDLKIKKGCFFVLSTQPGSFDSRYFGQVCEKDIKYKAVPFITF